MSQPAANDAVTRLRELFLQAVELAPEQRIAFLAELARDDAATAHKLAALIDADARLTQQATQPLLPALQALRHSGTSWTGRRVGRWRLVRELGSGGMGAVYLGEPVEAGEGGPVAIKLMHAWLTDPHTRGRFLRERQVLAKLSHPLVARYVDAGEEDGTLYTAMEYVDGQPLLAYADRRRLDLRERIALFLKACAAVSHAHSHRIVHRDIKSNNILVTADGLPKLLDFGIAKSLRATPLERTDTAQRFFSPYSAAPEQLIGGEAGVGTDVYGLGTLLYELVCGEPPLAFDGLTPGQIENAILGVEPAAPSRRLHDAPPNIADARARLRGAADRNALAGLLHGDIDHVVLMALLKDGADRYASVEDFAADLRRATSERPTEAARMLRWRRALDLLRRHRRLAIGIAVLAALVAAYSLGFNVGH